ncbi:MAG: ABC transporter ATP-binding protein [Nitrospira sp.]|nr:ABC transporter ATP-binding protein [Nitrospira sp.]
MIRVANLTMQLRGGGHVVSILKGVSFDVPPGQLVSIVGPSGSGKSTLLGLLAGLDIPTSGSIQLNGHEITTWTESQLAHFRRQYIGYIFQSFHLIPTLTALENVALPLELNGAASAQTRARELLDTVGLGHRHGHYPTQLSGGEQQRVAVARAFSCRPRILLADEPTGNLDSATGQRMIDLLLALHREHGSTFVLVTHDATLADRTERIITLHDGMIASDQHASGTTPSLDSGVRRNDGGGLDSCVRRNDGGDLDSGVRGDDGGDLDSGVRRNDGGGLDSGVRGDDGGGDQGVRNS